MNDKKKKDISEQEAEVLETDIKEPNVSDLKTKVAELEDQYMRAVADYRNLEKRVAEERLEYIKFANRELLERLLPSFDTLFLAEKYVQDDGLKLTIKTLYDALDQVGVKRIETVGKSFNPDIMECIETVEGEADIVTEEVRPGFTLFEKTLRPSLVKVGKGN
ncbi:MAG TPA: nucleotide exchange factor GrpE [Candidatus Levybacteria bacterium]|nr:nucleotide exchange factor GrpE [Candidatus Levybacteria bacterium]